MSGLVWSALFYQGFRRRNFGLVGACESLAKNMGESPKLVHQKGDPYRTKGVLLTYCRKMIFQDFAAGKTPAVFGRKLALARPRGWEQKRDITLRMGLSPRKILSAGAPVPIFGGRFQ
jgi:hypothetical protein